MQRREFCTYLDSRFLERGLALSASLDRHCPGHRLWVLCLDEACYATLLRLQRPGMLPLRLDELEAADPELRGAKENRTRIEYYFTCTPALPLHVFRQSADVSILTYLDADLFFFSSPEPLFAEIGEKSIAIVPHRFPADMRRWEAYGAYNVGWITFRRDEQGLACLSSWRAQCIEWCFDKLEGNRFADQKYLDDWPGHFDGVHVVRHKGANVASWNLRTHRITCENGSIEVDGEPLVFFHFHHLKRRSRTVLETDFKVHGVRLSRLLKDGVFTPYLRALDEAAADTQRPPGGDAEPPLRGAAGAPRRFLDTLIGVASGSTLVYLGGRVR